MNRIPSPLFSASKLKTNLLFESLDKPIKFFLPQKIGHRKTEDIDRNIVVPPRYGRKQMQPIPGIHANLKCGDNRVNDEQRTAIICRQGNWYDEILVGSGRRKCHQYTGINEKRFETSTTTADERE